MGTKHLVKDYDQIYKFENPHNINLRDWGYWVYLCYSIYILFYIFFRRELTNLSEENKKKIFKSILIIPIILLFTGFQFYRDFALQFFYFLLLSMMVKDLTTKNRN